jgi:hypothetical protein
VSIFGRYGRVDTTEAGVHQAVAEAISAQFGQAEVDIDVLEDPMAALAAAEIELDIDDEFADSLIEDEILGLEDDLELEEDVEPFGIPHSSRVASANEVRFGKLGERRAARQASRAQKQESKAAARQSKAMAAEARTMTTQARAARAQASPLGQMIAAAVEGAMGAGAGELTQEAGPPMMPAVPWWQQYIPPPAPAAPFPAPVAVAPPAAPVPVVAPPVVEAGPETLPPTYVADAVTAEPSAQVAGLVHPTESFGATADAGFVARQRRSGAKQGAANAVVRSMQALSRVPYGEPSTFVEDPNSRPVLFGDGRIFDEAYGELLAVPCPSCSHLNRQAAFAGVGRDCSVCDTFGAILMPQSDVPSYASSSAYGIIPLLVPVVAAGATLATGQFAAGKKKSAADVEMRKGAVMQRLVKRREAKRAKKREKEAEKATKVAKAKADEAEIDKMFAELEGADEAEEKKAVAAEAEIDKMFAELDSDDEDADEDEKVSGLFGLDEFGIDDDDEDEFGVDEWADEVFGSDDGDDLFGLEAAIDEAYGIEDDDEDIFGIDDEDEDIFGIDEEDTSDEMYGMVRVLVPTSER